MNGSEKNVGDIGERGLIQIISEILGGLGSEVLPGKDDAVAILLKENNPSALVINTDMLVSTTDVPPQMTLYEAGRKSVVMTVSDVLVKGAIPRWGIVAIGIPLDLKLNGNNGFKALINGLKDGFEYYNVKYLGGDLNESKEIIISCTILGETTTEKVIQRSGAKAGDIIISTGEFGKTGCGFAVLLENLDPKTISLELKESFITSVLKPETQIGYGDLLLDRGWVTASADSSDGVYSTIFQICGASSVGAELFWDKLPIAEGVIKFSEETGLDVKDLIFNAGEEFLHIYTIPEDKYIEVKSYFNNLNMPFYEIGRIIGDTSKIILDDGLNRNILFASENMGFEHFKEKNDQPIQFDQFQREMQNDPLNVNEDMPKFSQYPGACGLTSLLMAFKPKIRKFDSILDILWERIEGTYGFNSNEDKGKEFNWQRTLEWLLFQVERNSKIQDLLTQNLGEELFFPMLSVLKDGILRERPIFGEIETIIDHIPGEFPILSRSWIMNRVHVWKQNFELIILANLFGCKFIPWKLTQDGTGAIFFTQKELKKRNDKFNQKIDFLLSIVNAGEPVICCASIHWLAIKRIIVDNGKYIVYYHDPASANEHSRPLKGFREEDRFYLFRFYPDLFKKQFNLLKSLI
ncbi:MAG: thiamine-phosphate kinase [Promethearchaeota archaeon]